DQIARGAAIATVAGPFNEAPIAREPTTSPMSILPASPRKMLAGGKLNRRNPSSDPANTAATMATAGCSKYSAITVIAEQRIMPIVVARRSMPSSKLSELVAATSQESVNGTERYPRSMRSPNGETALISSPDQGTIDAAT